MTDKDRRRQSTDHPAHRGHGTAAPLAAAAAMVALLWFMPVGCETPPKVDVGQKAPGEPLIRVRIARQSDRLTITSPTNILVQSLADGGIKQRLQTPVTFTLPNGQWNNDRDASIVHGRTVLLIEPLGPTNLRAGGQSYPGTLRLVPRQEQDNDLRVDTFDVVNDVRLEAYLPGVLDKELYDDWQPATFMAQAIAARSFAIDRIINDGPGRHYDVESTQASQAYIGSTANPAALRSVLATTGMVLTYADRIIPAYYSSACGGAGQSAADAFSVATPPPLDARGPEQWCSISPYYRWGPIRLDAALLSKRIALWGASNNLPIASMSTIRTIHVTQRNRVGRPVQITITDDRGKQFALRADSFRHACNFSSSRMKLDPPGKNERLMSGFVDVTVEGGKVIISEGRGFGHGVGLCQYGAEGMARAGHDVNAILAEYYPTATVERAY